MALQVLWTRGACKELARLPVADRERVVERVKAYAAAPEARNHDVLALVGSADGFRLRVGDWRVLFRRVEGAIWIRRVAHRREVYR